MVMQTLPVRNPSLSFSPALDLQTVEMMGYCDPLLELDVIITYLKQNPSIDSRKLNGIMDALQRHSDGLDDQESRFRASVFSKLSDACLVLTGWLLRRMKDGDLLPKTWDRYRKLAAELDREPPISEPRPQSTPTQHPDAVVALFLGQSPEAYELLLSR